MTAAGRLETDRSRHAQRADWRQHHAAFGDRVAPRHGELIDAAIGLAFDANDLVELRSVEIDCRRSGRR